MSFAGCRENNLNRPLGMAVSIFYSIQLHGIGQLETPFFLVQNKVHATKSKKLGNGWNQGLGRNIGIPGIQDLVFPSEVILVNKYPFWFPFEIFLEIFQEKRCINNLHMYKGVRT